MGDGWVSHSTPKEVFVSSGQNYHHEIGACVGIKAEWKYSFPKRGNFVATFFYMILTAPKMCLDWYDKCYR